jgi:phosphatidylserine/phosphatidylglycerophosphate/cardiolipin synthase-like enzyme/uncharacterized membrane protein YdjX (TVP38/TMEM64 family)
MNQLPNLSERPLLVPGYSCWKTVIAHRLALIQDAGPTFAAIATAIEAARRSVFVVGWDLDSRTLLRPDAHSAEDDRLLPLLCRCLDRNPELEIFILIWDFSIIYAWEREPLPRSQFGRAHRRLHFALDQSASGGSHHQKIVVVDDELAFSGGVDLTVHRWDTPEHRPVDGRRVDLAGDLYEPFHDVHAAVSGPAAAALGELVRARWVAGRHRPTPPPLAPAKSAPESWPAGLPVDATDLPVGLARTFIGRKSPAIKEIEALTLDAIAAARRWIYAENQYLTSPVVARALAARLGEPVGPEIVLVLPKGESGWKEQSSMGVLRNQILAQLVAQDRHGRLRLLTPMVSEGALTLCVQVHSKVLVVDDTLAKFGSANFTSRSMGLDSECDLAVEADGEASAGFIALVRNRLLGEHLGLTAQEVGARLAAHGSLLRLVDEQPPDAPRRLMATPTTVDAPFDFTALDGAMVDPNEPWDANSLLDRAVPIPLRRRLARRWLQPLVIVLAVSAVWTLIRTWHPLTVVVHGLISGAVQSASEQRGGSLLAVLLYCVAAVVFVPFTLLATVTLAVFGMWPGVAIAWAGGVLSATLSHRLGGLFGPRLLRWLPARVELSVRRFMRRQGFWSVIFIRLVPLGNFGALNLAAGVLHVPLTAFVLGNMVGLFPGLLGLGIIFDRLRVLLRDPSPTNVALAGAVLLVVAGVAVLAKRRFRPEPERSP